MKGLIVILVSTLSFSALVFSSKAALEDGAAVCDHGFYGNMVPVLKHHRPALSFCSAHYSSKCSSHGNVASSDVDTSTTSSTRPGRGDTEKTAMTINTMSSTSTSTADAVGGNAAYLRLQGQGKAAISTLCSCLIGDKACSSITQKTLTSSSTSSKSASTSAIPSPSSTGECTIDDVSTCPAGCFACEESTEGVGRCITGDAPTDECAATSDCSPGYICARNYDSLNPTGPKPYRCARSCQSSSSTTSLSLSSTTQTSTSSSTNSILPSSTTTMTATSTVSAACKVSGIVNGQFEYYIGCTQDCPYCITDREGKNRDDGILCAGIGRTFCISECLSDAVCIEQYGTASRCGRYLGCGQQDQIGGNVCYDNLCPAVSSSTTSSSLTTESFTTTTQDSSSITESSSAMSFSSASSSSSSTTSSITSSSITSSSSTTSSSTTSSSTASSAPATSNTDGSCNPRKQAGGCSGNCQCFGSETGTAYCANGLARDQSKDSIFCSSTSDCPNNTFCSPEYPSQDPDKPYICLDRSTCKSTYVPS